MPEPIFMKLGMYIMVSEPIINGLLHKSLPSICLYMYPRIVARQRLGIKRYHGNKYRRNNRRTVGFVVSKESSSSQNFLLLVYLPY
jgi:hypothetical protein